MTFTVQGMIAVNGTQAKAELKAVGAELKKVGTDGTAMARGTKEAAAGTKVLEAGSAAAEADLLALAAAERQAAQDAVLVGRSHTIGAGGVANLTAQFNDIGVMLATGQNPLQLAIQQGTQITQVFGNMGVIGGLRQTGNYLLDCRFNKDDLVNRIRRIGKYRSRITFTSLDATIFLRDVTPTLPADTLLMVDPPYFGKGADLYTSFYSAGDHAVLAQEILGASRPWITTYDNCPEIALLYRSRRQFTFDIQYSAQTKRIGSELLIVSKGLRVPKDVGLTLSSRPR